jgi:ABC-type uncharacterized transport system involved in gliding motility auxiliary subunit
MKRRNLYSYGSLALLLLLFMAVSMLSSGLLKGMRFDLTENKLYTLSDGTINILQDLEEPVNLYLFFSEDSSRDLPQIRSYAQRVAEMVEEFRNHAGGKLKVHRIDPKPFSEEEDEAAAFGLQAVPVGAGGETLYLGIAGTNSLDGLQSMPFLQPSKEKFLEYDLAKMISTLGAPERRTLGLLSSLPMTAGFDPATQGMREAWVAYDQLSQLFQIEMIDPMAEELPADIDVLMLVHPKSLSDRLLYQVEQFVLGGGNLIAFIDPFAESDRGDPNDPMARMQAGSSSDLGPLLAAWGVDYDPARVVGDLQYGIGSWQARHIGILSVPVGGLNQEDIVSADLELVNLSSTGWLAPVADSATHFEAMIRSSENAAPMDSSRLRFLTNPAELMQGFNPTGERYALAARLSGPATAVMEPPAAADEEGDGEAGNTGPDAPEHRSESIDTGINVILFADTDMLTDRLWVQKQPFLGQNIISAFADNGSLAVNAVDNMLGNQDLINIRTRANSGRPFDRVSDLKIEAERSYRATEERLQQELAETEQKLTSLQSAKGEGDMLVLSDAQQEEIQRFMDRRLEIRRELRQVQHDLQRDIDQLGTRLKLINIGLVPALVMLAALLYAIRRRRAQQASRLSRSEPR